MIVLEGCDGLKGLVVCDGEGLGGMVEDEVWGGGGGGDVEDVWGSWEWGWECGVCDGWWGRYYLSLLYKISLMNVEILIIVFNFYLFFCVWFFFGSCNNKMNFG